MLKTVALVIAGLAAGFALAFWLTPGAPIPNEVGAATPAAGAAPAARDAASAARLAALEDALAAEVEQRAMLEARIGDLAAEVDALRAAPRDANEGRSRPTDAEVAEARQRFDPAARAVALQEWQTQQLISHGFSPQRAEWIMRRTQELRMETIQAEHDAAREGRTLASNTANDHTLRSELGDAEYEQYLSAMNRPTSVPVMEVLASSPGERAGLKPGDEVVSYGGERVFDLRDLNALTLEGTAGQSVVVEVRRDGQQVQLVMPRGPLGITGGFRGGRGPPVR